MMKSKRWYILFIIPPNIRTANVKNRLLFLQSYVIFVHLLSHFTCKTGKNCVSLHNFYVIVYFSGN